MLQVNNISLSFGAQEVFEDVSFNIHGGERIGLVGRNGSGKTSLFKILTGEIQPDSGTVMIPKNYTIGYLRQHLRFTEPSLLAEACIGLREEERDQSWKAEKMLAGLGFSEAEFEKSPLEFSGGFQVRLNLAKVLLGEPHLLLLDEPTNYLDIISIRWLIKFLRQRENELMIITHDRDFMNEVTTHTMVIHRKKSKKMEGDTYKLFTQIAMEEEVYEKTRMREQKMREDAEEFINRFRASAARAKLVQSRIKALGRMEAREELAKEAELGFKFNNLSFEAKTILRAHNVSFGYSPDKILINGLTVEIDRDDRICVIGKNGKGKSTLLRLFAGELEPTQGEVKPHSLCSMGYFGQTNIERLTPEFAITEELAKVRPDLSYGDIRKTCGAMMFTGDLALKKISVLSGGEKSRVSLGKILLNKTNLLLLDEPTNHLDMESCDSLIVALDAFPGAVVIVTHSEMFLHHLANRLIVFDGGEVEVFEGTYAEFLDRRGWKEEVKEPKKKKKKEAVRADVSEKEAVENKRKFKKAVEKIEAEIDEAERLLEDANAKLAEACLQNDGGRIKEHRIEAHKYGKLLEEGYRKLEVLLEEKDKGK